MFIDFAKAFQTVDHKLLLSIFENVGIRGKPYKLFDSYLNGKTCGVPQGTALGPILLFLFLTNSTKELLQMILLFVIKVRTRKYYGIK